MCYDQSDSGNDPGKLYKLVSFEGVQRRGPEDETYDADGDGSQGEGVAEDIADLNALSPAGAPRRILHFAQRR